MPSCNTITTRAPPTPPPASTMYLPRLDGDPDAPFPPAESARQHPNGLLACGGDLCPTRLMNAYRQGIFPWYSAGEPIRHCPLGRASDRA